MSAPASVSHDEAAGRFFISSLDCAGSSSLDSSSPFEDAFLLYDLMKESNEQSPVYMNVFETFVPEKYRGKGLASLICDAAFSYASMMNMRVIASCSYVSDTYIVNHPERQGITDSHDILTQKKLMCVSKRNTVRIVSSSSSTSKSNDGRSASENDATLGIDISAYMFRMARLQYRSLWKRTDEVSPSMFLRAARFLIRRADELESGADISIGPGGDPQDYDSNCCLREACLFLEQVINMTLKSNEPQHEEMWNSSVAMLSEVRRRAGMHITERIADEFGSSSTTQSLDHPNGKRQKF